MTTSLTILPSMSNSVSQPTERTYVEERQYKHGHNVFAGAPDFWSSQRGATHTLWLGYAMSQGTRPAKLLKTVLYVGVDEDALGQIVWEKWQIKTVATSVNSVDLTNWVLSEKRHANFYADRFYADQD
jgi:hypothetical protein